MIVVRIQARITNSPFVSLSGSASFRVWSLRYVGAPGNVSNSPHWVYDLLHRFQPSSVFMKEPSLARYVTARKPIKKDTPDGKAPGIGNGRGIGVC